jgi:hypothetical protein
MIQVNTALRVITCVACGAKFERRAWAALALCERIEPQEVQRILLNWSEEECIEVRSCRRCGRSVVAKCPVTGVAEP